MKRVSRLYRAAEAHWVGDGFPVRTMFSYNTHGSDISPFLLLDYAARPIFRRRRGRAAWSSTRIAGSRP
ncbi:MAG: hypothetical protein BroJett029_27490 [Alphaproteobacteria bacterium]|nr:MAG: hypothetical protein BroJett029_27490 [Alphaproteobacteria bacterium]